MLVFVASCTKQVFDQQVQTGNNSQTLQHVVAEGETLGRIADNYYGDPAMAGIIARQNGISDPNKIVPGSVLILKFDDSQYHSAQRRAMALEAYNKGVDLMAHDRLAEAEKQFRLATETAPDLDSARYNLALVLSQRGKNTEALVLLNELTSENDTDSDFLFAQGHCLFQLTRFVEAVSVFEKILILDGGHKRAAFGLARSLQADGQNQKAMGAWKRYLDLDSTSSWADVAQRNFRKLRDGS